MSHMGANKPRVEPRVRAMVRARLRDAMGERDICLIDVSTRGVLATTARPPQRGEFVDIELGRHHVAGQVKWAGDRRFGVALQERVSVAAVVEGGDGSIKLVGSRSVAKRRNGWIAALQANPEILGRAGQLGVFLLVAAIAAFFIAETAGAGFAPMRHAVMGMNHSAGG